MQQTDRLEAGASRENNKAYQSPLAQALLALLSLAVLLFILWQGFFFLRDSRQPKWIIASVAIVWGVGGVAMQIGRAHV